MYSMAAHKIQINKRRFLYNKTHYYFQPSEASHVAGGMYIFSACDNSITCKKIMDFTDNRDNFGGNLISIGIIT